MWAYSGQRSTPQEKKPLIANVGNTLLIYHIYGIKMPSMCDWLLADMALSLPYQSYQ